MINQSFYNNKYLKKVFDLDVINIKLVEFKIKQYIGFTPMTRDEPKQTVVIWSSNEEEALVKYGHISNWNVSNVNDILYR